MQAQHRQWLLILVATSFFMEIMDAMVLNTSLPQIAAQMHVPVLHLKLALTSYLLSIGLLVPINRYMAERFGIRQLFITANVLFILASLGCSLSHNLWMLIFFRVMQGVGGAFLAPTARLIILKLYKKSELYQAQIIVATVVTMGLFLGPMIGGVITTYMSWRIIFVINLPVGLLVVAGVMRLMPQQLGDQSRHDFSWPGFLFMALMLVSLLIFCDTLTIRNWNNSFHLLLLSVASLSLIAFFLEQRRGRAQLFDPHIWRNRVVMYCFAGSFFMRQAMFCVGFLVPILLQAVFGLTPLASGAVVASSGLGVLAAKRSLSFLMLRLGRRLILGLSLLVLFLLLLFLAFLSLHFYLYWMIVVLFMMGFAQGVIITITNVTIYASLDDAVQSTGTTMNSMVIQLGGTFSISFASFLLMYFKLGASALYGVHFYFTFMVEALVLLLCFPFYLGLIRILSDKVSALA
jgi:EmrB/QacA subfamily drug resistance transporter